MFVSRLLDLKGRRQIQYLFAVLDGDDAAGCKRAPLARALDLKQERRFRIARANEIGLKGMTGAPLHRLIRSRKRLGDHLAAEYARAVPLSFRRQTPEQVDFNRL